MPVDEVYEQPQTEIQTITEVPTDTDLQILAELQKQNQYSDIFLYLVLLSISFYAARWFWKKHIKALIYTYFKFNP